MRSLLRALSSLGIYLLPVLVSAHEVYVLTPEEIAEGLNTPAFDPLAVVLANTHDFMFWGFTALLVVLGVLGISIIRPLERWCMPYFAKWKLWAPHVSRITIGLAFIVGALFQASFGPELPISDTWNVLSPIITAILLGTGLCIVAGAYVRSAAVIALIIFGVNVAVHGSYMFTYANYLGEIIVLLLLGVHAGKRVRAASSLQKISRKLEPYAFLILRVAFGVSLIYSAIYAKFVHNDLALQVAQLHLGHAGTISELLGFEPHFLVVGAGIIEVVIGLFFVLGIEIRFTSLFLEFWLGLSLYYFGESVWPHLILIGIPIAFILYGYDKYSLEGLLFKRKRMEPVM